MEAGRQAIADRTLGVVRTNAVVQIPVIQMTGVRDAPEAVVAVGIVPLVAVAGAVLVNLRRSRVVVR
jgi:hypothetical protein